MKRLFVLPSLMAAGFGVQGSSIASVDPEVDNREDRNSIIDVFKRQHKYYLAAHRSHSSHASHGSHRSSSGGSVYVPSPSKPLYNPTPPKEIMPPVPEAPKRLPGFSPKFKAIVAEVQTCLFSYGYYHGKIDGVVGVETSAAISKLQAEWKIPITGTVTPEVLDACRTPSSLY